MTTVIVIHVDEQYTCTCKLKFSDIIKVDVTALVTQVHISSYEFLAGASSSVHQKLWLARGTFSWDLLGVLQWLHLSTWMLKILSCIKEVQASILDTQSRCTHSEMDQIGKSQSLNYSRCIIDRVEQFKPRMLQIL